MMYRCYAIDDESYAIEKISEFIIQHKDLSLVKSFVKPLDALSYISSNDAVDVIFLDVEMGDMDGIEMAKRIRHKTKKLIFCTGHSRYGYDAFEVDANGFLLKPYSYSKFEATVNKLFEGKPSTTGLDVIFVKNKFSSERIKVVVNEIVAIEAQLHSIKIYTVMSTFEIFMGLTEFRAMISENVDVLQVHRSFIISLGYIISVERNRIKMKGGILVPIGSKFRGDIDKRILNG